MPGGRTSCRTSIRKTKNPSKVQVEQRLREFPAETFCKSAGTLFCRACKQSLPTIKSSIVVHRDSEKHKENKSKYLEKCADDESIKEIITEYYVQNSTEVMGTVSAETMLYRWRVVEAAMLNGIPLYKLDGMRPILERGGDSLCSSTHLKNFIPKIHLRELTTVRSEVKGQYVCLVYDATTKLGEAIATLARPPLPPPHPRMHTGTRTEYLPQAQHQFTGAPLLPSPKGGARPISTCSTALWPSRRSCGMPMGLSSSVS